MCWFGWTFKNNLTNTVRASIIKVAEACDVQGSVHWAAGKGQRELISGMRRLTLCELPHIANK